MSPAAPTAFGAGGLAGVDLFVTWLVAAKQATTRTANTIERRDDDCRRLPTAFSSDQLPGIIYSEFLLVAFGGGANELKVKVINHGWNRQELFAVGFARFFDFSLQKQI